MKKMKLGKTKNKTTDHMDEEHENPYEKDSDFL
jgi:hypothetical protein